MSLHLLIYVYIIIYILVYICRSTDRQDRCIKCVEAEPHAYLSAEQKVVVSRFQLFLQIALVQ